MGRLYAIDGDLKSLIPSDGSFWHFHGTALLTAYPSAMPNEHPRRSLAGASTAVGSERLRFGSTVTASREQSTPFGLPCPSAFWAGWRAPPA